MEVDPLLLDIQRIVTDSDLDGVVTASILRRWWPDSEVIFGHPGELRAGLMDHLMNRKTAVCDLPRHPECGLSIDHHQSNKPLGDEDGVVSVWRATPSAARIAHDLLKDRIDLSDLDDLLDWVDKLDGGGVTREEYLSDTPAIWLGRVIDVSEGTAMVVLEGLQRGVGIDEILKIPLISSKLEERKRERETLTEIIADRTVIMDRIAVARLDGLGMRSNGYHVTAFAGDSCDACIVIHGEIGASFGDDIGYPVSASFYTNSFLHRDGGIYDLTALATHFDPDGGGHANACGCRIKPLDDGKVLDRAVTEADVLENISQWLKLWAER
ncbi:MAG TPA: hypothetical protein HA315_01165 [Candidatus Thalassarchaeaceae archaeon]|nr:MAG TPA: hypothetical protein D7H72_01155 [Candidatus Poseidoniales archaeon]HII34590.1 hypothetical protein [Candidatus Thalassarchaeaceae archaeon]